MGADVCSEPGQHGNARHVSPSWHAASDPTTPPPTTTTSCSMVLPELNHTAPAVLLGGAAQRSAAAGRSRANAKAIGWLATEPAVRAVTAAPMHVRERLGAHKKRAAWVPRSQLRSIGKKLNC